MDIRLLGPIEVSHGERVVALTRQQRVLLAALALRAGEVVSTDRLVADLWGERALVSANGSLQNTVSALRKLLGRDLVVTQAPGYRLAVEPDCVDAHRFERLLAAANRGEPAQRAALLREALGLWHGPALADLDEEEFARLEAGRLDELRVVAFEERIEAELALGEHAALVGELETLVATNPLRERLRGQLMLALYRGRRQAEALEVYRQGRAVLADELGLEPAAELRSLEQRILAHDPHLDLAASHVLDSLPTGTVTFLFSDVEDSTRLLEELGAERYAAELAEHRRVLRSAFTAHGGVEVDAQGEEFFVAFPTARGALDAAAQAQADFSSEPISVRIGLHTGTPLLTTQGYVGWDVHRAARIAAAGHGGQVLVSESTAALLEGSPFRDLGLHRFKDLAAAERVYQLGEDDFAPLRSFYRTNLPVPPTRFLGRERELAEVVSLARDDSVRVVTVTGAGGIGKTRLALQAAAEVAEERPDGVFWAPLAALNDPALVLSAVAQALGTADELGLHIGDRRMLILVDNLEHLLEAAGGLGSLLSRCPRLQLLVTSRERLAIAGEHEFPLSTLTDGDGQQLFAERARALDPGFLPTPAVAELCQRLDNLPLALELAAAWTKLFSPEQLIERLPQRLDLLRGGRDAELRQQTLRATIEWSHDLLDLGERQLFAHLGAFAGGCTLEAAETVCDADPDRLASLLDKSLLRRREGEAGEARFWMLETIREYALERLDKSDDVEELRRRHATYFFELAATAQDDLGSQDEGAWLGRLSAEIENLRAVLAWSLDNDVGGGLRFAASLRIFWLVRGHGRELARWFEAAFQSADVVPAEIRAQALLTYGNIRTNVLGDSEGARELYAEGLRLARQMGDERLEARLLNLLGVTLRIDGSCEEALRLHEQALATFQRIGDSHLAASSLHLSGETLRDLGQFDNAARKHEQALAILVSLGERWAASNVIHGLGDAALEQGDAARASDRYREAIAIAIELDDKRTVAYGLAGLSCATALAGDLSRAGTLWAASHLFEEAYGSQIRAGGRTRYEHLLGEAQSASAFVTAFERGCQLTLEHAREHALAHTNVDGPGSGRRSAIATSS